MLDHKLEQSTHRFKQSGNRPAALHLYGIYISLCVSKDIVLLILFHHQGHELISKGDFFFSYIGEVFCSYLCSLEKEFMV